MTEGLQEMGSERLRDYNLPGQVGGSCQARQVYKHYARGGAIGISGRQT